MHSLIKCRQLLRSLPSVSVRKNIYEKALGAVCCNYHAVVNNQSLIDCKRYRLHNPISSNNIRFKSKKKQRTKTELYSDDEEEDVKDDEVLGKGEEIKTVKSQSLRLDQLYKQAFNISRTRVDELFFENRFRLNGEIVKKKSISTKVGDEVDVIKGLSKGSNTFLDVNRFEILSVKPNDTMDGLTVKLKKSKSLTVENYPAPHNWKQIEEETSS